MDGITGIGICFLVLVFLKIAWMILKTLFFSIINFLFKKRIMDYNEKKILELNERFKQQSPTIPKQKSKPVVKKSLQNNGGKIKNSEVIPKKSFFTKQKKEELEEKRRVKEKQNNNKKKTDWKRTIHALVLMLAFNVFLILSPAFMPFVAIGWFCITSLILLFLFIKDRFE